MVFVVSVPGDDVGENEANGVERPKVCDASDGIDGGEGGGIPAVSGAEDADSLGDDR